jgi:hypothetical protein
MGIGGWRLIGAVGAAITILSMGVESANHSTGVVD